jgi:hypothetical protein
LESVLGLETMLGDWITLAVGRRKGESESVLDLETMLVDWKTLAAERTE